MRKLVTVARTQRLASTVLCKHFTRIAAAITGGRAIGCWQQRNFHLNLYLPCRGSFYANRTVQSRELTALPLLSRPTVRLQTTF